MRWTQFLAPLARQLGQSGLNALLPPLCLSCDQPVAAAGSFCAPCWQRLTFIGAPCCPRCGIPYELETDALPCPSCLSDPPPYSMARSAVAYDAASRPLVLGFKHADQTHLAGTLARMMAQSGQTVLTPGALLTPVPLHRRRLFRRCYNQSALLARTIAQLHGLRCVPDLLLRRRHTPPQARLKAAARRRNVRDAFALNPRRATLVSDQTVILVDDVMTTGATLHAAARVLQRAGVQRVDAWVCARVA